MKMNNSPSYLKKKMERRSLLFWLLIINFIMKFQDYLLNNFGKSCVMPMIGIEN